MSDPTQAAHVWGKGRSSTWASTTVVWGTDSIWYGSPQDQIQGVPHAFEISPQLQEQYGYPALTADLKRKVLGLNGTRTCDRAPDHEPLQHVHPAAAPRRPRRARTSERAVNATVLQYRR